MTGNWHTERARVSSGWQYRLFSADDNPLSFRHYFELLAGDREFSGWYTSTLRASGLNAYFWEHPPISIDRLDLDAEFVLIDAPVLQQLQPDPLAFEAHFRRDPDDVLVFSNLSGDATLIVPRPEKQYAHLAEFLAIAERKQIASLWRSTAELVLQCSDLNAHWLSTSGLGVYWPHIRWDCQPKYYQHNAYRESY